MDAASYLGLIANAVLSSAQPADGTLEAVLAGVNATVPTVADALLGDPAGPLDLGKAVMDHFKGLASPDEGPCVAVSAGYFAAAMKTLGVRIQSLPTQDGPSIEMPAVGTSTGKLVSIRTLVAIWFSTPGFPAWSKLPSRCRGAGAPGALLFADLAEDRTIITSNTGWPEGMKPGACLQLWRTKAEYEALRDDGTIPESVFGHSCVFGSYVEDSPAEILVYDQMGLAHSITYPFLGFRFVMGANLSKASLTTAA